MSKDKFDLDTIFHEAHVIDFDFSKWDKFIRLVVVASMLPLGEDKRYPLFNVDFHDVSELSWKANHLGIELESPQHHCQWTILEFKRTKMHDLYEINLTDMAPPSPSLMIRCRSITVSRLSNGLVDIVNPKWNRPYGGLARPSLQELK